MRYPGLVKELTLNHPTIEGRSVNGIEITQNPQANDGKPIFLSWASTTPASGRRRSTRSSSPTTCDQLRRERAHDRPRQRDPHDRRADGQPGRLQRLPRGAALRPERDLRALRLRDEAQELPHPATRRRSTGPASVSTTRPAACAASTRTATTAGSGAAAARARLVRGHLPRPGPFSEPESQNIRDLQSTRSITNLITNHTFSNLRAAPAGLVDMGRRWRSRSTRRSARGWPSHNGYANIPGYGLYDTTGTTEDWTFWTAGSLATRSRSARTGSTRRTTTASSTSTSGAAVDGRGQGRQPRGVLRDARGDRDAAQHSMITGSAPAGSELRIRKTFQTPTSPVWNNAYGRTSARRGRSCTRSSTR